MLHRLDKTITLVVLVASLIAGVVHLNPRERSVRLRPLPPLEPRKDRQGLLYDSRLRRTGKRRPEWWV